MRPPRILSDRAMRVASAKARLVPIIATLCASSIELIPMTVPLPIIPPLGLMMLIAWRLLRPELWPAWAGLAFGLFDDLVSGQPIGTAMAFWTASLLLIDLIDRQLIWRDYLIDWLIGGLLLLISIFFSSLVSGIGAVPMPVSSLVPQMIIALLLFPLAMRIAAKLDGWRLPSRAST